jgi:hypothetical protein
MSLLLMLIHKDPGTSAVAGVSSNAYRCLCPLLTSLLLLLVRDAPGTSPVDGIPSIAITTALLVSLLADSDTHTNKCQYQYICKFKAKNYFLA